MFERHALVVHLHVIQVMGRVATPMTVRIYHRVMQPQLVNKCLNHLCEDLCLPKAEYRALNKSLEKEHTVDVPYQCFCEGKNIGVCLGT